MDQCSKHVIPPAITANLTNRPAHDLTLELNAQQNESADRPAGSATILIHH